MDIRTEACFALSCRLMHPPAELTVDYGAYSDRRNNSLSKSQAAFSDLHTGKDILDFGCGDGQLSLFLAKEKHPRRIVGVDIDASAIERARASLAKTPAIDGVNVEFVLGSTYQLPVPDQSFDTLLAFECLEHVMSLDSILCDWYRVLRPGGQCLIEWFPYNYSVAEPDEKALNDLKQIKICKRYQHVPHEELAILTSYIVASKK